MVIETKKFPGLGGQGCLVEVNKRIDGSVYVVFRSEIGYGDPFIVTKGYGRKYVEDNFPGISVEIING